MSRWIDADAVIARIAGQMSYEIEVETGNETDCVDLAEELLNDIPSIDIVRCKECKHRPIKEDADGENYGFNLIESNDGDARCPCLVSDGWYSWMPEDDFYCGYGERKSE